MTFNHKLFLYCHSGGFGSLLFMPSTGMDQTVVSEDQPSRAYCCQSFPHMVSGFAVFVPCFLAAPAFYESYWAILSISCTSRTNMGSLVSLHGPRDPEHMPVGGFMSVFHHNCATIFIVSTCYCNLPQNPWYNVHAFIMCRQSVTYQV